MFLLLWEGNVRFMVNEEVFQWFVYVLCNVKDQF